MIRRWTKPRVEEQEHPRGFDDYELQLGDVMRGERATLGKSLLDVQRELKIKATYIAAIENSDPSVFETQGFIAGYVRSYARYLNLDPDWAFVRFCSESGFAVAHGMSPEASTKRKPATAATAPVRKDPFSDPNASFVPRGQGLMSRIEPGALGSTAVLLALLGVIGYGGWSVLQEIQKVKMAPVDQAPAVIAEVAPLGGAGSETRLAQMDESIGLATPSAEALDRLYRPQALDVPVLVPRDGPIAALDPRSVGALAGEGREAEREDRLNAMSSDIAMAALSGMDEGAVRVVEDGAPELALVAVRPSWVRVQAADGSVLFEKILDAGERYIVPAMDKAPILRTGNGGGVYFAVNGQAYGPVGASGSVVKNVALSVADVSDSFAQVDLAANDTVADAFQVAQNSQ
ncbi:helix-turn-helix domain-containing protein [Celeribacter baekdonensis]|uniref:helix-turn-helix domain-containing protein n=1 Tax=Celeribacter baekdonensis TaxID=875171 RepID=UPI0030D9B28F